MDAILINLPSDSFVLDLGCAAGSFRRQLTPAKVIRFDRAPGRNIDGALFVQGDAAHLPFANQTFDVVVSNHSLEHFDDLASSLREIGRVILPAGALFASVPDASTFTDKLYRWLARGGGHVNAFTSSDELVETIERVIGLKHRATRILCSSLSFLNRRNAPLPRPRRLMLLGAGYEWSLFLYVWFSRRLDLWFKTRTSVYGWAFYFGTIQGRIDTSTWRNVCIRCGSGCSASVLTRQSMVGLTLPGMRVYRCPQCDALNPFADE